MEDSATTRGYSGTQNYQELKKKYLASRCLFEDPEFPPNEESINFSELYDSISGPVVWKRPSVWESQL